MRRSSGNLGCSLLVLGMTLPIPALGLLQTDAEFTGTTVAIFVVAFTCGEAVSSALAAVSRISRIQLGRAGIVGGLAGAALPWLASTPAGFVAGRVLHGFGTGALVLVAYEAIGRSLIKTNRSEQYSNFSLVLAFSLLVGSLSGGYIASQRGLSGVLLTGTISTIIGCSLAAVGLLQPPASRLVSERETPATLSVLQPLNNQSAQRQLHATAVLAFTLFLARSAERNYLLPQRITETWMLGEAAAGVAVGCVILGSIVGVGVVRRVVINVLSKLLISASGVGISIVLIGASNALNFQLLFVLFVFGLFAGFGGVLPFLLVSNSPEANTFGRIAHQRLSQDLGIVAGPLIAALLISVSTSLPANFFSALIAGAVLINLIVRRQTDRREKYVDVKYDVE